MRGCSTNEAKKGEIGKMFLKRRFDVCALNETKLKGKGEIMFGEVVVVSPVTEWAIDEVCSRMEGGVIQAYVG